MPRVILERACDTRGVSGPEINGVSHGGEKIIQKSQKTLVRIGAKNMRKDAHTCEL